MITVVCSVFAEKSKNEVRYDRALKDKKSDSGALAKEKKGSSLRASGGGSFALYGHSGIIWKKQGI